MRIFVKAGVAHSSTKQPLVSAMTALQYAKKEQKEVQIYESTLSIIKEFVHNSQTVQLLQDVIKNRRVQPYFQPIYSIKNKRVTKYEALMRIEDETATVHSPATFLDVAKKAGLYRQLSKIMLEKSLHAFLDKSADVTLNISTLDVENGFVMQVIEQHLRECGHLHGIVFEITEQEGIRDFDVIRKFIGYVKSKGAKVALDDFGSGYSNFENLVHLQIDYLKIDGSLIKNLATDQNSRAIVETLVEFARKFDIETVAEFICDEAVAQKATQLGVDYLQGFHIAKPAPLARAS
jgi:EAL domain-containing protein (putative c-di-GMP-specific phosphodiesterase class I)